MTHPDYGSPALTCRTCSMPWNECRGACTARYQENAADLDEAGPEHRAKFVVGARLRYLGPSDETPPTGLEPGELVTVAERNEGILGMSGMGIAVVGPRGGVDMVWWYEVELA